MKNVSIMVPFIATTAIIPVALWDSGPEPEERFRIAVIMETFRLHLPQIGSEHPAVL